MRALFITALLLGAFAAPIAHAQDREQLAQYRSIATEGQEAFNRGEFEEAERLWEEARTLLPNPRVYALLGRVAQAREDHVRAVRMYRTALTAEPNGNPLTPPRRREVEGTLLPQSLEHVGELVLELEPAGATITVDGRPAEVEEGVLMLPVGSHALAVQQSGYRTHEQRVEITAGMREPLRIVLEAGASGDSPAAPVAPSGGGGPDLAGPLAMFGVAGAGVVLFAIGGGLALAENDRLATTCGSLATVDCTDAQLSDLHTFTAIADVGWVLAAAAATAGIVWLVVAMSSGGERSQALSIAPFATADGVGLVASGEL